MNQKNETYIHVIKAYRAVQGGHSFRIGPETYNTIEIQLKSE